jgi:hypothetical protein
LLFLCIGSLTVRVIRSKPLASIENAYCEVGTASQIIQMRRNAVALRGPRGRVLKADQSLSGPIVILKVDCLGIQLYLHISLV